MSRTNISSNKDESILQLQTVNSINLDITDITKFVNGVEKHFGNYLFNKYIKLPLDTNNTNLNLHNDNTTASNNDNTSASNNDNTSASNNDKTSSNNDTTASNNDTIASNNEKLYKEFCTRFYYTKKALITQDDIIKKDISDMRKANILYLKYPELDITRTKTDFGYPSKYRCNFIRISKHKMQRCKNKISDTNDDTNGLNSCIICSKHIYSDNIYREQYYKLYNKLINS